MRRLYEAAAYGTGPQSADGTNFWRSTTEPANNPQPLAGEAHTDIAVIGAGVTGLNAALALARDHGADVRVLEAQGVGFGASGRAGGFCCLGGARLAPEQIEARLGPDQARLFFDAERAAVDLVEQTLEAETIDADVHSDGETLLAHSASAMAGIRDGADLTRKRYGVEPTIHEPEALLDIGMAGAGFHGGVTIPVGFALNPLKYTQGLARAARAAGAKIHEQSAVTGIESGPSGHRLTTAGGVLHAKRLIVATNGYSSDDLPGALNDRYLPVQSSILTTRPLTAEEQAAQGWTSLQMCYDTRHLLHYFRLMPDGRMLFGLRGAVRADAAAQRRARARARRDFEAMFPAWRHVETPHFWSGLLCFSRSFLPFVGPLDLGAPAFAAMAYHGNGIAMGSYAGRHVAAQSVGAAQPGPLPDALMAPMGRFGLGPLRRAALATAYPLYRLRDLR